MSREKLRYTISTIIIFVTALLMFIRLDYLLGLFSAPVADVIFVSFSSFLFLSLYMREIE